MEDDKIAKVRQIAKNLVEAAHDIEHAVYKGDPGVCPHCHSRNFYLDQNASKAICCLCGIEGAIEVTDGKLSFVFPEDQISHAHNTLSGKFKHANDIRENEEIKNMELKKNEEYKKRVERYKIFISPSVPQK